MTGTVLSSQALDARRSRALFRCWRRGTREMDLLIGRFADEVLPSISDEELGVFEQLIEVPDSDLYGWLTGRLDVPANYDTALFRRFQTFSQSNPAFANL